MIAVNVNDANAANVEMICLLFGYNTVFGRIVCQDIGFELQAQAAAIKSNKYDRMRNPSVASVRGIK